MADAETRLVGWKAIAAYLHREERTAMRWANERGLPVHRLPGPGRGSVYALSTEINAWLHAGREPAVTPAPASRRWLTPALIAGVVMGLGTVLVALAAHSNTKSPASAEAPLADSATEEIYLQAKYDWNLRTSDSLARAAREFGEVIARDPRAAKAYAGLANTYLLLREDGSLPDAEAYPRAQAAAEAAVALDPQAPAPHRALAFVAFWWLRDRATAKREFAEALALAPNDALTHQWFATALSANGEHEAALREIIRARELDSNGASTIADQGILTYLAGRRGDGVVMLRTLKGTQPDNVGAHRALGEFALFEGRPQEFLDEADTTARLRKDAAGAAAIARWRKAGDSLSRVEAAMLQDARDNVRRTNSGWYRVAQIASLAGRREEAGEALAHACNAHEPATVGAPGSLWLSRALDQSTIRGICGGGSLL